MDQRVPSTTALYPKKLLRILGGQRFGLGPHDLGGCCAQLGNLHLCGVVVDESFCCFGFGGDFGLFGRLSGGSGRKLLFGGSCGTKGTPGDSRSRDSSVPKRLVVMASLAEPPF